MLILTRRLGQDIIIGDDIVITILGVQGGQARLGITAPSNISVHRAEVYERIKRGLGVLTKLITSSKDNRNEKHERYR